MNLQDYQHKKFFIKTLGCKVNQYESQAMRELLTRSGFTECMTRDIADIYILNTCTVTDRADSESRRWIALFHKTNPDARIVVTGCYVEDNADEINFLPGVAHILKNKEKNRIAEILGSAPVSRSTSPLHMTITDFKGHTRAFVKIQDGCDNLCSYCKVPLVRSGLSSRPIKEIAEEVRALTDKGFKEIVLTGICLGAWGRDLPANAIAGQIGIKGMSLVDVLKELDKIPADFRIRLSSVEPRYVTGDLIDFISGNARICHHLHIPFQSGDDDVLKKMKRPYTAKEYISLADKIRARVEDVAITTDMLIGFPGESDANFRNTVAFIKDILPSRTHIFTFSRRRGTAAYSMEGDLSQEILKKRFYELKTAALSASYIYRARFLEKVVDILVETKRDRGSGLLTGYSDTYIKALFEGPDELMNNVVPIRIKEISLMNTMGDYEPGR